MDWRETIESDGGEAMCSSGAEKGNEQKGRGMFPSLPYGRGHKWEKGLRQRREYKREGAMSFRAVANQTNGRRKARQKENER